MHVRTEKCNAYGQRCLIHPGIYHYQCADCGNDCTAGTKHGPANTDTDGVTRCSECHSKVPRFMAIGPAAVMGRAAPALLEAAKTARERLLQIRVTDPKVIVYQTINALTQAITAAEGLETPDAHKFNAGGSCIYCGMYYAEGACPSVDHPNYLGGR